MITVLLIAIVIDAITGDPKIVYEKIKHPVTWMAALLMLGEGILNNRDQKKWIKRTTGFIWISLCSVICFALAYYIEYFTMTIDGYGILLAIVTSVFLAFRSLIDHVNNIREEIEHSKLERSREELAKIVGRETRNLDEKSVIRASIESLAENFSDGFIAPAFWFLVAGLPGLTTYKMINTADSMIGNKSARFVHFGWASAKLDDIANFIPARITAALFVFASLLTRIGKPKHGISIALRDSSHHASPNAGWPEATMAGVLNIKLGGPRMYNNGSTKDASWLGAPGKSVNRTDLKKALQIVKTSWGVVLVWMLGGVLLW